MKWTLIASLVVLGLVMTSAADMKHFFEDDYLDEEAMDQILAASWLSKAIHDVGDWTKKAASSVADTVKKGCGVVNSLPGKELMLRREQALRNRGVTEDQAAALYGGYKTLKGVCQHVG